MRPQRIEPGPGQESVWDYPRPPVAVPTDQRIRVVHRGVELAETNQAIRILETSQPPAYYLPVADIAMEHLTSTSSRTMCEWKGLAGYWTVRAGDDVVIDAAWSYPAPVPAYGSIAGHIAFYAQKLDECWVGDERVDPNDGSFYGGWITSAVVGPFKGAPGTLGW
ncbi:MAG: DUF427 domain-containing protein [Ilumatobacteraceae bacterium]